MIPLPLLLLSVVLSIIIGFFGRKLRFGFWGYFFVSLLFTPVIGLLMLFAGTPTAKIPERRAARR